MAFTSKDARWPAERVVFVQDWADRLSAAASQIPVMQTLLAIRLKILMRVKQFAFIKKFQTTIHLWKKNIADEAMS